MQRNHTIKKGHSNDGVKCWIDLSLVIYTTFSARLAANIFIYGAHLRCPSLGGGGLQPGMPCSPSSCLSMERPGCSPSCPARTTASRSAWLSVLSSLGFRLMSLFWHCEKVLSHDFLRLRMGPLLLGCRKPGSKGTAEGCGGSGSLCGRRASCASAPAPGRPCSGAQALRERGGDRC